MTLVIDSVANTLQSDGDLVLECGDDGCVVIDGCEWPTALGFAGRMLTNEAGSVSWQPGAKIITANTTYYVATSGSDVTGDGSSGTPWATIAHALGVMATYRFARGITITIQLADGAYTIATPVMLTHADGSQISIVGATVYSKAMSSVQSSSGSTGAWAIIINLDSVSNIAVGDYVLISAASGGTAPQLIEGCHVVTAVDSGTNRITITSKSKATSAPSGAVAATVKVPKTRLVCSTIGFYLGVGAKAGLIDRMVMVGPGAGVSSYAVQATARGRVLCSGGNFGIASFYGGLCAINGSVIEGQSAVISDCNRAVQSDTTSCVTVGSSILTACFIAAYSNAGGYVHAGAMHAAGNDYAVYAAGYAYVWAGSSVVSNNGVDYSPALNTPGNAGAYIDS